MSKWVVVLTCVAGCWGTTKSSDTIENKAADKPGLFTITQTGFGPITASSPATLENLRALFPGYQVRPVNDPNLEYHIYAGNEQLAFVVLNDDMSVFNVHATSGRIAVSDRSWRVGETFQGSYQLSNCECWGDNPTCYKTGEHVAVNFKRGCDGVTSGEHRALRALDGLPVQRVIWSPTAFGEDAYHGNEFGGDAYGGNPCGGGGDPCGGP
jgi:hypothetical protein